MWDRAKRSAQHLLPSRDLRDLAARPFAVVGFDHSLERLHVESVVFGDDLRGLGRALDRARVDRGDRQRSESFGRRFGLAATLGQEVWTDDLWDLVLAAAQCREVVAKAVASLELSLVARHALELAQRFNGLYHQHPILQETSVELRTARLAAALIFRRALEALAGVLGVPIPERM